MRFSLRQMGILQTGSYSRTLLGTHVAREPLGALARDQRSEKESQEWESIEEVVIGAWGYTDQYLDMEFCVSHEGCVISSAPSVSHMPISYYIRDHHGGWAPWSSNCVC